MGAEGKAGRLDDQTGADQGIVPDQDFDEALYRALVSMASKSPRFQADVHAAMRQANLSARPTGLAASLQRLENAGRVSQLIPLRDGGLLITVSV